MNEAERYRINENSSRYLSGQAIKQDGKCTDVTYPCYVNIRIEHCFAFYV
jgi:hypothetical protein